MMTDRERFINAFDLIASSGMVRMEAEKIMSSKKAKYMPAGIKIAVITVAVILCLAASNLVTYAVSGNAWIVGTWQQIFGTAYFDGKDYPMEYATYMGDGYSIEIDTAVLGDAEQPGGLSLGDNSEGVNVIANEDGVFLIFGENKIDITRQINEIPQMNDHICAAGTVMLGNRKVVFIVRDLEQFYKNIEEERGVSLEENPGYQVVFYDYDVFSSYLMNDWLSEPFKEEIINSETIIAK